MLFWLACLIIITALLLETSHGGCTFGPAVQICTDTGECELVDSRPTFTEHFASSSIVVRLNATGTEKIELPSCEIDGYHNGTAYGTTATFALFDAVQVYKLGNLTSTTDLPVILNSDTGFRDVPSRFLDPEGVLAFFGGASCPLQLKLGDLCDLYTAPWTSVTEEDKNFLEQSLLPPTASPTESPALAPTSGASFHPGLSLLFIVAGPISFFLNWCVGS